MEGQKGWVSDYNWLFGRNKDARSIGVPIHQGEKHSNRLQSVTQKTINNDHLLNALALNWANFLEKASCIRLVPTLQVHLFNLTPHKWGSLGDIFLCFDPYSLLWFWQAKDFQLNPNFDTPESTSCKDSGRLASGKDQDNDKKLDINLWESYLHKIIFSLAVNNSKIMLQLKIYHFCLLSK